MSQIPPPLPFTSGRQVARTPANVVAKTVNALNDNCQSLQVEVESWKTVAQQSIQVLKTQQDKLQKEVDYWREQAFKSTQIAETLMQRFEGLSQVLEDTLNSSSGQTRQPTTVQSTRSTSTMVPSMASSRQSNTSSFAPSSQMPLSTAVGQYSTYRR